MWKKAKIMRMSRKASPLQIVVHQKQLENVEYFKYLGSMITNDARYAREIKSKIAMEKKQHSIGRRLFFTRKLDLNLKKKIEVWSIGV
jgi:hypothetical protein